MNIRFSYLTPQRGAGMTSSEPVHLASPRGARMTSLRPVAMTSPARRGHDIIGTRGYGFPTRRGHDIIGTRGYGLPTSYPAPSPVIPAKAGIWPYSNGRDAARRRHSRAGGNLAGWGRCVFIGADRQ